MLNDTASLPPEPVNNRANTTGVIVQEALGIYVCRAKDCDIDCRPNGAEQVKGGVGAVLNQRVVILE